MAKRLTTEKFIERAKAIHGDKYDYSETEYVSAKEKVEIFCKIHNYSFFQEAYSHAPAGNGCPKCAGKYSMSNKEFIEYCKKIHNNKYDYSLINSTKKENKIKIICPVHGIYETKAGLHKKGYGCKKCATDAQRLEFKEYLKKIPEELKEKYNYIELQFNKNKNTMVLVECEHHGQFLQRHDAPIAGKICKKCSFENRKLGTKTFIERARKIHGNKYDYSLVEYVDIRTPVTIICDKHGKFFQVSNAHLQGCGCKTCSQDDYTIRQTKTLDQFIKDARSIHGDKYDYSMVKYINGQTKVDIICLNHGIFSQQAHSHCINGAGCPSCNNSTGERKIDNFLRLNDIEFSSQAKFDNAKFLKSKRSMRFDFYIKDYNLIIEYDGEQHFRPVDNWGGEKKFKSLQKRDLEKNNYCLKNNIDMLRIPYTEFNNIEEVLKKKLNIN